MAVIPVELAGRSYEVRVGGGLLADLPAQCGKLLRKERVPIVTDANVARHWREPVETALLAAGHEPRWLVLDPGEGSKSWQGLALVTDINTQFALHIDEGTYTTIGGYVLGRLGRRPRIGDAIEVEGSQMRVDALDGLRVARVWLSKPAVKKPEPASE